MSEIVKFVKTGSTTWMKEHWPSMGDFHWQAGYGIFSIGQTEVEATIRYIQVQEEHHKRVTFKDEFRELMRLAGMEIDEKYVWD